MGRARLVQPKPGVVGARALTKELHGLGPLDGRGIVNGLGREVHWRNPEQLLADDPQRLATRSEDSEPLRRSQERLCKWCDRVEDVLAVVEDEHHRLVGDGPKDRRFYRFGWSFARTHRHRHSRSDVGRLAERSEVDEPHAVGHRVEQGRRRLEREAGLATTTRTSNGHESVRADEFANPLQLRLAPDEHGELYGQVVVLRRKGAKRREVDGEAVNVQLEHLFLAR